MKREIKILMHTHWDREWYFTKDETQVLLRNHMFQVIEFLEQNEDIVYILDGQSVMLDDFIEFAPKWKNRIENLVRRGALRVGPWYTQTDLLLVHGESIIRNLYYGMKKALEYGNVMKVGYAPDTFGHSSQMPQIYKQFGIESSFFWRGFSELKAEKSDFIWKGIDGSTIFGINLATGYQGAKYLESDVDELKARMDKILKVLDNYSASSQRLIMNGHDQMPIQKNIHEIMKKLKTLYPNDEVKITTFEEYVEGIRNKNLEIVEGELVHSKHSRIHRTINSTRMDIKLLNTELEYKIYNILEPLAIMGKELKIDYPYEVLEKCLKILFGTHAHDSIGGCNSDLVNRDIKQRLLEVKEIIDTQIELYMRLISLAGKNIDENVITVYNFLPYRREQERVEVEFVTRTSDFKVFLDGKEIEYLLLEQEIVDAGLIDRQVAARLLDIKVFKSKVSFIVDSIDGLEIKYLTYKEGESSTLLNKITDGTSIENQYYKLEIKENKLNLLNKKSKEILEDVFYIESSGDGGDSYDYSPPYTDRVFNSKNSTIKNVKTLKNKEEEIIFYTLEFNIPKNQASRDKNRTDITVEFFVEMSLNKSELVNIRIVHKNLVEDTRFRAVLNTRIKVDRVESDSHLCVVNKPVFFEKELSIWEKDKWAEKPVSIETFNSYVCLKEKEKEGTIFAYGLKEYEVVDGNIYITLFRTFSHLGKRELINRPGRPSGIEIPTPDNQLKDIQFDFNLAFSFVRKGKNNSKRAKEFLTPIAAYQLKEFNRFNLNSLDISKKIEKKLNLELGECVVSALNMSEDDKYIFIRIFNPNLEIEKLNFERTVYLSNMFQEKIEKIETYSLRSQEILNILIER